MKRMIGMVAAMALVTSSAALGQVEIHQYFTAANAAALGGTGAGGLVTTPADWVTNPHLVAAPGAHVFLATWIRALQGDSANSTVINGWGYEVTGQGNLGSFSPGQRRLRTDAPYVEGPSTARDSSADYVDLPGVDSQFFGIHSALASPGTISSAGGSADSSGATLLSVIEIVVSPTALNNDTLNLYLTTPKTSASRYATNGVSGSLTTVAFGADSIGGLDRKRASNPTQDILGTLADRVSTTPDAVITVVVPEPGTLSLLALGLLGLRRRRI